MSSDGVDKGRRRLLITSVAATGAVGAAFTAVPFLSAWKPSARAKAAGAPVEVDISKLELGERMTVQWRGKPVWIVRRDDTVLGALGGLDDTLRDPASTAEQQPEYATNEYRSIRPEVLVLVGSCTHLGCSPRFVPEMTSQPFDSNWKGGFFCPCHNSRFDMAGRVYQGVPAPLNLEVPPYSFIDDNRILVGVDPGGVA